MSFSLTNTAIPTLSQIRGLFSAAPKDSSVITVDYSVNGASTVIPFLTLLGSHVINVENITGGSATVALPPNSQLLALFLDPDAKSIITYILEVDNTVTITSDDNTDGWQTINAGVYTLLIQITNVSTPAFDIKLTTLGASSISTPGTLSLEMTNNNTTLIPSGSVLSRIIVPGQYGFSSLDLSGTAVTSANLQLPTLSNLATLFSNTTQSAVPITVSFYVANNVSGTGAITLIDSTDVTIEASDSGDGLIIEPDQTMLLTITLYPNGSTLNNGFGSFRRLV